MDLSPSRVKPTAITLVCAVFPTKHAALKAKTGWLGHKICVRMG
jgi:hypothetical protein